MMNDCVDLTMKLHRCAIGGWESRRRRRRRGGGTITFCSQYPLIATLHF